MELKVLGRHGPYAAPAVGACSGYLVTDGDFSILLDFGSGVLARMMADCPEPDAVFISHLHFDHTSDLLPYRYYLDVCKKTATVITEKGSSAWYNTLFSHSRFTVVNVQEDTTLTVKGRRLSFFRCDHPSPNLGIRITNGKSTLVYTGDTRYFEGLEKQFEGADLVLCDCAQPVGFQGGHMTVDRIPTLLRYHPKKLLMTHVNPNEVPSAQDTAYPNVALAEEGKIYSF